MNSKLHISHFKELYKSLKTPFPPINFLILGMLMGLEQRWVNLKAKQTVDDALDTYMEEYPETVYEAVVEECEDGNGYTIGYFPEKDDEYRWIRNSILDNPYYLPLKTHRSV